MGNNIQNNEIVRRIQIGGGGPRAAAGKRHAERAEVAVDPIVHAVELEVYPGRRLWLLFIGHAVDLVEVVIADRKISRCVGIWIAFARAYDVNTLANMRDDVVLNRHAVDGSLDDDAGAGS